MARRHDKEEKRRPSPWVQGAVVILVWLVPLTIFAMVSVRIGGAIGLGEAAVMPDLTVVGLFVAVALVVLAAAAALTQLSRRRRAREEEEAPARWDRYTTPGHHDPR